jgi:general secretion pathway protein M
VTTSTPDSPLLQAWSQARTQAQTQWQALGERERFSLKIAGAVLGAGLAYFLLIAPAQRTARSAPAQLEALEAQLQQMQAQAAEARTLRNSPTVPAAQAQAALTSATERLGPAARLQLAGDRAMVSLNGVGPEALQAWLGEVRAAARARPVEAQLTRGPKGFSGSVVLLIAGAP